MADGSCYVALLPLPVTFLPVVYGVTTLGHLFGHPITVPGQFSKQSYGCKFATTEKPDLAVAHLSCFPALAVAFSVVISTFYEANGPHFCMVQTVTAKAGSTVICTIVFTLTLLIF